MSETTVAGGKDNRNASADWHADARTIEAAGYGRAGSPRHFACYRTSPSGAHIAIAIRYWVWADVFTVGLVVDGEEVDVTDNVERVSTVIATADRLFALSLDIS